MDSLHVHLLEIISASLSPEKATREAAEAALNQLSSERADLLIHLLHLCTESEEVVCQGIAAHLPASASLKSVHNALLGLAIRFRNVISRGDWNRVPYFTEEVKRSVRDQIVPRQCGTHVSELVRRQLLAATGELIAYDYPKRWPGLVAQLNNILSCCVRDLASGESVPLNDGPASSGIMSSLSVLKAALGVLRNCCRVYENPVLTTPAAADSFAEMFIPPLIQLGKLLVGQWSRACAVASADGGAAVSPACPELVLELSSISAEYAHCLRLCIKCCWSLTSMRWPKVLCAQPLFEELVAGFVGAVTSTFEGGLLPIFKARLTNLLAGEPSGTDYWVHQPGRPENYLLGSWTCVHGDCFALFSKSSHWRVLKWCNTFLHKLTVEFLKPKECEKRCRKVATLYAATYAVPSMQQALRLIQWHQDGQHALLTSKAWVMAIEIVNACQESPLARQVLSSMGVMNFAFTVLFPRLALTLEEAEMWNVNPEEYVRKQSRPMGDLFNPKFVGGSLLLKLLQPTDVNPDGRFFAQFRDFTSQELAKFMPLAIGGDVVAARHVDAALFVLLQSKRISAGTTAFTHQELEWVMMTYALPATQSAVGFLRARAVQLIAAYSPTIVWSSAAQYESMLEKVLPLLHDSELPVAIQTCVSISRLIRHQHAYNYVAPRVADLVSHYFSVMRKIDNDSVIRTLRKTIKFYGATLTQWAVQLCDLLVQHFDRVAQVVVARYSEIESMGVGQDNLGSAKLREGDEEGTGEEMVDALMVADEILATMTTLVRSIPPISERELSCQVFAQMQQRLCPMMQMILSAQGGSSYGFMDNCMMLLTTLLARCNGTVVPETWALLPCLGDLVLTHGSVDCFAQLLPPLDNFVCSAPTNFVTSTMGDLCKLPPHHARYREQTPASIVFEMTCLVLKSDALQNNEVAAVPKLYDSILQNMWSGGVAAAASSETAPSEICSHPQAQRLAEQLTVYILSVAASRPKQTAALRLLLANSLLSSIVAQPLVTATVLCSSQALGPLFEMHAAATESESVAPRLRSYDRILFVLAFARLLQLVADLVTGSHHGQRDVETVHEVARALTIVLTQPVPRNIISAFTVAEVQVAQEEVRVHEKQIEKHQRGKRADADGGDVSEDSESCISSDDDDSDDDDEDFFGAEDMDEDDDDEEDDGEASDLGAEGTGSFGLGAGSLVEMAAQARAARGDAEEDDEDNCEEEDAIDLLVEDDFSSPIDNVNSWDALVGSIKALVSLPESGATLGGALGNLVEVLRSPEYLQAVAQLEVAACSIRHLHELRVAAARLGTA